MGIEIEKKYLVVGETWRCLATPIRYRQGYLSVNPEHTVRVRLSGESHGTLTIKGLTVGITRPEFEYQIPAQDAEFMLNTLCQTPLIDKLRYRIPHENVVWEVDEFFGPNAGLVVAEIELRSENQVFTLPNWIGREVTDDPRYFNANLVCNPFSTWSKTLP